MAYNAVAGRWSEEITASRIGLDAALSLDDPVAIVRSGRYLARALVETGHVEEANEPIDLILKHQDRLPPEHRAATERGIALVRSCQERFIEAREHARRALDIARQLDQRHEIALSLLELGWGHAQLGDHSQAIVLCRQGIPMMQELGDHRNEAGAWDSIGYAQQRLGDLDAAIVNYRKAIRIYGEIHYDYGQAETLDHLGSAQLELGDIEQARESRTRAADLLSGLRIAHAAQLRLRTPYP
ncbi:tetratricopeptide repeat protein [Streptomyces sp. NPDC097727]|uniref:tetratricopeptide repeat protein n=1 Tax=Streptomyces sp. NPDC097727 TaxID=3366092 RepID=UPI0038283822